MNSNLTRATALALSLLVLAACQETPTEPTTEPSPPPAPSLALASNTWVKRADMPSTERFGLATAAVTNSSGNSVLYAMGGRTATGGSLSTVQAYHVSTNRWTYPAKLPAPLFETNGAGVIKGKIYVSGGRRSSNNGSESPALYLYNPATNRWTRKHDMPYGTWGGVTDAYRGKLYVLTNCGDEWFGCESNDQPHFFRYDPASNGWTELPPPSSAHQYGVGGFIGGKFYVTGGQTESSSQLDVYDPVSNSWTTRAPLPGRRWRAAGTTLKAKLYVIGGVQLNSDGSASPVRTTTVYDPSTDSWTTKAPLPTARADISGSHIFVAGDPRIEVVGGPRPGNNLQYIP